MTEAKGANRWWVDRVRVERKRPPRLGPQPRLCE
jgi:hypothetical protein